MTATRTTTDTTSTFPHKAGLHLLAYPLTTSLHGTAYIHRFPPAARSAWDELRDRYVEVTGSRGNLPYTGLATALRAVSRTSVNLSPTSRTNPPQQLVSRHRLNRDDLHDAVTIWEQALLDHPADEITCSYPSQLADLLAETEPEPVVLADEIRHIGDQPDCAGWVYDVATWELAARLAESTWTVDGRDVHLRADTDGNLLVWDNTLLWSGRWNTDADLSYAALRIKLSMKTLPWIRDPVVIVEPTVSWLSRWMTSTRTLWLAPRASGDPLLVLGSQGRGHATRIEHTSDLAVTVWSRMIGEPLLELSDRDLGGEPGRLRALVPNSVRFPIGRGVGMHTVRELSHHIAATVDEQNLTASPVAGHRFPKSSRRQTVLGRDADLLDHAMLPTILEAAGCQRLRILVLYTHQHTRARLQRLLAFHLDRPDLAHTGIPEDRLVLIGTHVEVLFHHAPTLLAHGDHTTRNTLLDAVPGLDVPDSTRVMALCETEYDARAWSKQRRQARRPGSTVTDPDTTDAKHVLNRLLAHRNVLAQFVATAVAAPDSDSDEPTLRAQSPRDRTSAATNPEPENSNPTNHDPAAPPADSTGDDPLQQLGNSLGKDHRGHSAVADTMRAAGLIHPRLTRALAYGRHGLDEPLAFVGLHVRKQQVSGPPRLSWSLVALIPDGQHWHAKAYQASRHPLGGATGWQDYATANTAFRANPLPQGKRDRDLSASIDAALAQLSHHLTTTNGRYVLLVSGESTRSMWPQLANKNLDLQPDSSGRVDGHPALPGGTGPRRPRAVVRITHGTYDLPRPVELHTPDRRTAGPDADKPTSRVTRTTEGLYHLDHTAHAWILANIPRQFSGGGRHRRLGENLTRWDATTDTGQQNWYSHTTTEIVVLGCAPDDDPTTYAVATARLCDHAISWDGRTSYPAPIHLARAMDKDHPEYRRTVEIDETIELDDLAQPVERADAAKDS